MKHKTRTKALSWLLSLALMLSLVPGMSMTAYADESMVGRYFRTPGNGATETIEFTGTPSIYLSGVTKTQTLSSNSVQWKRQKEGSYQVLYFNDTQIWHATGLPLGIYFASGSGTQSDPYVTVWNESRGNGTKLSDIYPHDTLGGVDVLAKTDSSITLGTVANDRWVKVTTGDNTAYTKLSENENTVLNELSADATFGVYGRFNVTYNKGEAESGTVPTDSTQYQPGTEVVTVLGKNDLAKAGYVFKEWNTRADGQGTAYQPGATFTSDTGLTLYAIWEFSQNSVAITLPGELTLGDGWTASDGITAAVGADGFPDGKQVTVTAESANGWKVKLDESNSVDYAAYSGESDNESITSWVFSSDDLTEGKTLPAGFKLTLPAEAQKGIYTDSITFKAAIDTPAPEYANQLVYVGNSSNTSLPNGATGYAGGDMTYKGAQLTAEQGKALAVYLANKTGKKSVVAYASQKTQYGRGEVLCLAKSDGTTFTGELIYRLSDWGVSGWEFYYVSTTAQSSGGASEPEAVIELGAVSVKCYVHAHSFTSYTVNQAGDTITATCGNSDGYCYLPVVDGNHTATLTIAAPQHSAVGDGKSAEAVITDAYKIRDTAAESYYAADASGNKNGEVLTDAPTGEGKYWAEITLGTATAHVVYEITDPDYEITLPTGLVGGTVKAKANDTEVTKAKYNNTVTLTASPNEHYHFNSFTVKDSDDNPVEVSGDGDTRTFTMPASNVTVTAEFEGDPFTVTVAEQISNGTVTAKQGDTPVTQAKAGSEVTLTVTPATGYQVDTVKYNDTAITPSEGVYKFTMPTEAVTVTATFVGKDMTATLTVNGSGGTAALLDDSYNEVKSLTKKAGEKFILLVDKDDGYDYNVKFGSEAASLTEFTKEQYEAYLTHAKANSISVPMNMALMWVTMPGVSEDSVNATVTFSKLKTFTVLYQPTDNPTEVWCRIGITSNNQEHFDAAKMKSDSEMGGTTVWSVKVTAAFDPTGVGFFTSKADAEAGGATVSNAAVSQSAGSWTDVTGGKYIIIGGNAKTVIAAFVDDANALTVYDSETVSFDYAKSSTGVRYQIAVCQTDASGNVTTAGSVKTMSAPATAPEGKTFDKWSVLEGTAPNKTEKRYEAGQSISIKENTIFTAVWKPTELTVKLNPNGGTGVDTPKSVIYGNKLEISAPTRDGYVFDGWTVNKSVTEDGKLFAKGSAFDLNTKITANLELTAQWKHVHSYSYYKIGDFPSLSAYQSYEDYIHVAVCGCGDIKLEAHNLDSNGACACGYGANQSDEVTLKTSFGQMSGGTYTQKMAGKDRTEKKEQEVTVYAPSSLGDSLQFSKWIFTIDDGTTWYDLSTSTMVSFVIPCDMQLRALYINPITQPQVELSARSYDYPYQNTTVDAILFQMNYKLPDGYTFVDAGVRLGDNQGISYYELKEKTISMTAETQAIATGFAVVTSFLGQSINTFDTSASEKFYDKRENNVLDEMSAATLAEYMYESKPVNVEKYEPIYWETKATTKGLSGSINSLAPLRFVQKNNGDHYIYGIGWMRYKDKDGNIQTIYTEALDATLNGVLKSNTRTVTKSGS